MPATVGVPVICAVWATRLGVSVRPVDPDNAEIVNVVYGGVPFVTVIGVLPI